MTTPPPSPPPPVPFHSGCYCYRDSEADAARQAGLTVRCGNGLPCQCVPDLDSLLRDSPNETGTIPRESSWDSFLGSILDLKAPPNPVENLNIPVPFFTSALPAPKTTSPTSTQKRRRAPACSTCACPCADLHRAAAVALKLRKCCGGNCRCPPGKCACPQRAVPGASVYDCCAPNPETDTEIIAESVAAGLSIRAGCCSENVAADVNTGIVPPLTCRSHQKSSTASDHAAEQGVTASTEESTAAKSAAKISPLESSAALCDQQDHREEETVAMNKSDRLRTFRCPRCPSTFYFKQNRDRHITEVHLGKRPHKCTYEGCDKAFKNSSGLKQHQRTVHEKVRPFKCTQCDAAFGQRNHLTQHVLVLHEKVKMYACDLCDKSFSNVGNRTQHMKRIHSKTSKS